MDLRDYPRPPGDTGIGVHWNAGFPAAIGLGQIRDVWLPELIAMGVKWVKITRHDGGLEFCELLLKHDIMPIVRLYRPQPNPGTLDRETLRSVSDYVAAGVRYFEFNNEPNLGVEWQNGFVPPDALQIVARNAIIDMEAILERGGYPGIPALAVGSKWDLVGEICRLGHRDLLAEPVWQAIHNYSLNHPLDYPYDPGNQEGAPYTREFYDRLAQERWGGDAWGGWSLERVNQERREHANPGATAFDDPSCWRAYERYDKLIRDQIGRSLPILATENGYIVGERPDPRYPATTPQLHMAQTLEACRIMMGTSSRFDHAPDYYFCTAFWLLGNYTLGHWAPQWEGQAWYSARWPGGQLPIVAALKAEPKQPRVWRGDGGVAGRVTGHLKGGAHLVVMLQRADGWSLMTKADGQGHYEFQDVPLGAYTVALGSGPAEGAIQGQQVNLTRERPTATANFDLTGITIIVANSTVRGTIRGGAGRHLRLTRPADGWHQELMLSADGSYCFPNLPAGTYVLNLLETQVVKTGIELDGHNEVVVDLAVPGWGWEAGDGGPSPGFGIVRCRVAGHAGLPVRIWATGWSGMSRRTGSKPEFGPDVCEFAPLGAGTYTLQPEGLDVRAQIILDGQRVVWVTFSETVVELPQQSIIAGTVMNGAGRTVRLLRSGAAEPVATVRANQDGQYSFTGLPAGSYTVQVMEDGPESEVAGQRSEIVVDGTSQTQVDFALPPQGTKWRWEVEDGGFGPGFSLVRCQVAGQSGRDVRLWTLGWSGITQRTGTKPEYGPDVCEFAPLGPGIYFVAPQGLEAQAELRLEPNRVVWVRFLPPAFAPEPQEPEPPTPELPAPEPEMPEPLPPAQPGRSTISGTVVNGEGLQVVLSGPTGERRATVADGRYSFDGLLAGTYRVAVLAADPALGTAAVREEITVDGVHPVIVDFVIVRSAVAGSKVWGRVRGGAGRTVALEGPLPPGYDPAADREATIEVRTTTVGLDELYSFTGLLAGTYRAIVQDTDPPTGITQFQAGIELDGTNSVQVDFDLDALGPGKAIEHYLLVGSIARSREDFLAVLQYVARFQPVVGTDETEAQQARHVTILGGIAAVSALVEQGLRMSGCQVQRIETDFAEKLKQFLDEDRPY